MADVHKRNVGRICKRSTGAGNHGAAYASAKPRRPVKSDRVTPVAIFGPMTTRDAESLAWSLGFARRKLEGAFALAAPTGTLGRHILRGAWAAACRDLHYLEMLVRRLLVALAGQLDCKVETRRAGSARGQTGQTGDGAGNSRRHGKAHPLFPACDRRMALSHILSGLSLFTDRAAPVSARNPADPTALRPHPVIEARRLAERFAALVDVLTNPEAHALRLARAIKSGHSPLRLGTPPALARGDAMDLHTSAYVEAERLALVTLNRSALRLGLPPSAIRADAGCGDAPIRRLSRPNARRRGTQNQHG
ncbi:MAG: hypothetical protein AAF829_03370 [Pseudomonadota bacterium]